MGCRAGRFILGLVAPILLAAGPAPAPIGGNLVANPGFEEVGRDGLPESWQAFTAWGEGKVTVDEQVTHQGKHAIRIEGIQPVTQIFLRPAGMEVAPGEQFYASAWVRTDHLVGGVGAVLMADFLNVDGHSDATARFAVAPKEAAGGWKRIEGVITVPAQAKTMHFRVGIWNSRGVAWFDDVELRALTSVSCRIDLATPRLTPGMTTIPVTVVNRAGEKAGVRIGLSAGKVSTGQEIQLNGAALQRVEVETPAVQRGPCRLACEIVEKGDVVAKDQRDMVVPAAVTMSPAIPTHWAVEDGAATVDGEIDLAVSPEELAAEKIRVELQDGGKHVVASWESGALKDGLNPFHLDAGALPVGGYTVEASIMPLHISLSEPFAVIHRAQAETTLNADGYLVQDGKAIFPLGIFNGAGKSAEMGAAGFTVQHAYNACDVIEGQRPNDQGALEFLNKAQAAGLKCLFLIPRGFVFAEDWEAFRRRVRMFKNHPALLAWDEEEGLARGDMDLKSLAKMCQIIRQEDPHHPIMIGDARDEITKIADRATLFPADLMDLGMWWWYPIPPRPGAGSLLNGDDATSAYELTPPSFLTRATTKKPIWVGVQSYKKEFDWARYPTAAEYRAQAYIAIIHGAKGLMWYGGYVDGGVFAAPPTESHWTALAALAKELHGLSDVLMAPALATPKFEPANAPISLSLRQSSGRLVLLAANRDRRAQDEVVHLPMVVGSGRVLGEAREVAIKEGELRDHFDGYAVHVYELSKSP
ncbi:MAG TPA: carbohydrate binding domain-containing protein [Tepidisphaeraceae bacterium]|jgi:hypothetical protein|nr:carbohydrate binding domain-containing protein [Tepidisphaeraceae bacterium]